MDESRVTVLGPTRLELEAAKQVLRESADDQAKLLAAAILRWDERQELSIEQMKELAQKVESQNALIRELKARLRMA